MPTVTIFMVASWKKRKNMDEEKEEKEKEEEEHATLVDPGPASIYMCAPLFSPHTRLVVSVLG